MTNTSARYIETSPSASGRKKNCTRRKPNSRTSPALTTMGELAASIAHEINQPLGAIVNNGNVAMRLATAENDSRDELVEVLSDIVNDANRTSAIIARIRAVMRKSAPEKTSLQLKDVVADVLALAQHKFSRAPDRSAHGAVRRPAKRVGRPCPTSASVAESGDERH